jgi:hypothetical protein
VVVSRKCLEVICGPKHRTRDRQGKRRGIELRFESPSQAGVTHWANPCSCIDRRHVDLVLGARAAFNVNAGVELDPIRRALRSPRASRTRRSRCSDSYATECGRRAVL